MNRKSAPKITEAVNFTLNLKPYETLVLDNGVKVYAINEGPQDIIQIEIVFRQATGSKIKTVLQEQLILCSKTARLKNSIANKRSF